MDEPKVIIGLPVYNGQKYLGAAIESHLSQTFTDFDLVISDNGSTDATPEICAEYGIKDNRVKYLRSEENRGILWNHRRVLDAIKGPNQYFRWAGADDIMEPGLLQTMVTALDTRSEVVAVVPGVKNIDDKGEIFRSDDRTLDLQSADVVARAREVLMANYQHVVAYGLIRSAALQAMRTQPDYIGWDPIFIWELALRGQIVQPPGPVLLRRFHPGSISRVKTVNEMRKWVEPNSKAGMNFPHWTWAYERARALMGCPMPARDRWRIGMFLARFTLWQRGPLFHDVTQATRRMLRLSDEYTF